MDSPSPHLELLGIHPGKEKVANPIRIPKDLQVCIGTSGKEAGRKEIDWDATLPRNSHNWQPADRTSTAVRSIMLPKPITGGFAVVRGLPNTEFFTPCHSFRTNGPRDL